MPELTIVESWRVPITRSSGLTRRKRSRRSPALAGTCSSMSTTIRPLPRSWCATVCLSSASISPLVEAPARSSALNAKVLTSGHPHGSHEPPQLLRRGGAGLGQLAADHALAHQLGERGVHGLHAVRAAGLQCRVDLVGLALPDQVAHRGRRYQDLGGDAP